MRRASIILRFFALFLIFAGPLALVGWLVQWPRNARVGAIVGAAAGFLIFGTILACAGRWVLSRCRISALTEAGLKMTLQRALGDLPEEFLPKLCVTADALPNAMAVRGPFQQGSLLLSRGAIETLSEGELRALIKYLETRLHDCMLPLQTVCAVLTQWVLELAPANWTGAALGVGSSTASPLILSPGALLAFLILLPPARGFQSLAGGRVGRVRQREALIQAAAGDADLRDALRKIQPTVSYRASARQLGFANLYFEAPGAASRLLAL